MTTMEISSIKNKCKILSHKKLQQNQGMNKTHSSLMAYLPLQRIIICKYIIANKSKCVNAKCISFMHFYLIRLHHLLIFDIDRSVLVSVRRSLWFHCIKFKYIWKMYNYLRYKYLINFEMHCIWSIIQVIKWSIYDSSRKIFCFIV